MAFSDWSSRLVTVGASTVEVTSISASYQQTASNVQAALDTLVESLSNAQLLVMLNNWRANPGPFQNGYPGGGLLFGTGVAVLTGQSADDAYPISAGTGQRMHSVVSDSSGNGTADWKVLKEAPLNPAWAEYGAKFDGATDDTAAWTALFAALPAAGGEIYVPPIGTSIISQVALPTNSTDIVIRGGGSRNENNASCRLLSHYNGAGTVFQANAAAGLRMSGLRIENDNAAFTGKLLDLSKGGGTQDTTQPHLQDMNLRAVIQSGSTVNLLELTKATIGTIEGVYFYGGRYGVEGLTTAGDYCNAITIGDGCLFASQDLAMIHNLGNGCRVKGVTFENLRGGGAGAYLQDAALPGEGLSWLANWTGDGNGTGSWITWNGQALTVLGGLFDTAANAILLNGASTGLAIDGAWFNGLTAAVNLNSQTFAGLSLGSGNSFNSVTNVITGGPTSVVRSNDSLVLGNSGTNAVSVEVANTTQRFYHRVNSDGTPVLGNSGGGDLLKIGDPNASWTTLGVLGTIKNELAANEVATATAGGGAAVPATVLGFLVLQSHSGTTIKIPYFAA